MPNSVQAVLIASKSFFGLLEHENELKTLLILYIFYFRSFEREFSYYEEAQKSQ